MSTKAVFLDRDGVINVERGDYTWRIEDFVFREGLFDSLRAFQKAGYGLIVITNQGGIAKGRYTSADFDALTDWMLERLDSEGVHIDDIFYSPHHQDHGLSLDRKPDSLMIERALHRHRLDPALCVMIGDSERDIFAAEKVGVRGILIGPDTPWPTIENQVVNG